MITYRNMCASLYVSNSLLEILPYFAILDTGMGGRKTIHHTPFVLGSKRQEHLSRNWHFKIVENVVHSIQLKARADWLLDTIEHSFRDAFFRLFFHNSTWVKMPHLADHPHNLLSIPFRMCCAHLQKTCGQQIDSYVSSCA